MHRILNLTLLLSFFVCYIDFGHDGNDFIGQTEFNLIASIGEADTGSLFAFMLLTIGQVVLIFSAVKPKPNKAPTIWGMVLLGIVVLFVFGLGLLTGNMAVVSSTLPFFITALVCISYIRRGNFDNAEHENDYYRVD